MLRKKGLTLILAGRRACFVKFRHVPRTVEGGGGGRPGSGSKVFFH